MHVGVSTSIYNHLGGMHFEGMKLDAHKYARTTKRGFVACNSMIKTSILIRSIKTP